MSMERFVDLAVRIQQVPAPTFEEAARAEFVRGLLIEEGLSDVQVDAAGNVLARLPGKGTQPPLILSAHLDTVFPAETDLTSRREGRRVYGPGLGDNSLGVAGLFGALWALRARNISLPGDLWLVANTGEEGLGDLVGMRAIVERFGNTPILYLVLEGMAFGHIYHKAIGVRRYKITARADGGHSWIDYGRPSAIHELSKLVSAISSFTLPLSPRTTLNIGRIGGGTSINTIAADAWIELDLRSENTRTLNDLAVRVEKLVEASARPGLCFDMEVIGQRPAGEISASHPMVRLAQSCLIRQGVEPSLTIGSTDANIPLSLGYPSIVLGVGHGGGAHTVHEYIDTSPLESGLEHLVEFISRVWD